MQTLSSAPHRSSINVTPLIDVLLVLLIIFMVIQPTTLRGLEAIAPQPPKDRHAEADPQTLVLEVRDGAKHEPVYLLNGSVVPVEQLPATLASVTKRRLHPVLFVQGDSTLDYAVVTAALDMARQGGADSIAILTPHVL